MDKCQSCECRVSQYRYLGTDDRFNLCWECGFYTTKIKNQQLIQILKDDISRIYSMIYDGSMRKIK